MKLSVVIAKYIEPISWIESRIVDEKTDVYIYDKSKSASLVSNERVHINTLPNIGREAHTYLHHIIKHYDEMQDDDYTMFLQGDPFFHIKPSYHNMSFVQWMTNSTDGPVCPKLIVTERRDPPFRCRVAIHDSYTKIFNEPPLESYTFSAGAQYVVPNRLIKNRPKEWWIVLMDMLVNDEINPWEIERHWVKILYDNNINQHQ